MWIFSESRKNQRLLHIFGLPAGLGIYDCKNIQIRFNLHKIILQYYTTQDFQTQNV